MGHKNPFDTEEMDKSEVSDFSSLDLDAERSAYFWSLGLPELAKSRPS